MKQCGLLAALIVPLMACAADYSVQPVTIRVPDGFEGPVRQEQQGAVVGFAKNSRGAQLLPRSICWILAVG